MHVESHCYKLHTSIKLIFPASLYRSQLSAKRFKGITRKLSNHSRYQPLLKTLLISVNDDIHSILSVVTTVDSSLNSFSTVSEL